ncbi:hypothetical protein Cob_v001152 [Colletotrichum orbiculare MAFF 240422]|uniref:Uncharacterized protein n=1 Tax=Colletotrichum orbiculare (strain 104-T / ATCC 96160 / CBS 514.97 / LARS 414 / MAFF 240422) TaxID=1213857 RepID=A0A484G5Y3_COLOR|nr:hypothetical protein Cob_v001152 [Colletotrichum orbiculare MAFF 240422]
MPIPAPLNGASSQLTNAASDRAHAGTFFVQMRRDSMVRSTILEPSDRLVPPMPQGDCKRNAFVNGTVAATPEKAWNI